MLNKKGWIDERRLWPYLVFSVLVVAILRWAPDHIFAQAPSPVTKINEAAAKADITVQALRGNISLLMGSGGNIAVFTSGSYHRFRD
jgi:hypothetical protein